jgi:hypothetical protein
MLADVQGVYNYQDELYATGNKTWSNIQNMTSVLQQSNGSVQVLLDTVAAAMDVLGEAKLNRQAVETIINTAFVGEATDLGRTLATLKTKVDEYLVTIQASVLSLNTAEAAANSANRTIYQAMVFSTAKQDEMESSLTLAKQAAANATEALDTTTGAKSATAAYKSDGQDTKSDATQAIVDVVKGIQRMQTVNDDINNGNQAASQIDETVIPPKVSITNIAQEIINTVVSSSRVQQVSAEADAALLDANRALAITQRAS